MKNMADWVSLWNGKRNKFKVLSLKSDVFNEKQVRDQTDRSYMWMVDFWHRYRIFVLITLGALIELQGLVIFSSPVSGSLFDTTTVVIIPRISDTITFDGKPFDEAWKTIVPFPMIMHSPVFGKPVTERTEIMVAHDDKFLWVGARLYVSDPSDMQVLTKKRDDFGGQSDYFTVVLDTYEDNESAVAFMTNPSGARTDMTINNDAEGDMSSPSSMPMNASWNTFWDVLTVITDEGWFVEMRIPLSSLRFQDSDGKVTMGLIVWRWIPGLNEMYTYPPIPRTGT